MDFQPKSKQKKWVKELKGGRLTTNHKLERHLVSFIKEGKNEKLFLASS